ncbi:hypothetical protein HP550_10930 [Cellulomonas humilata]|uniref:Uncharacterized protein n=1 Tax=Cellulomonas humilata TaxID=144055 RepID=A0A7Y6A152_9CELL|nr:hypothetical protein [Cellulomonas humilata]
MSGARAGRAASLVVAGDVVRALAVASVVVGTWRAGLVACALFLLVLGGTLVPRAIGAPAGLDVAYCSTLLFAAWSAQLEWYAAVDWLDLAVHAVATGLVAVMALLALVRWRVVAEPAAAPDRIVLVTGLGATAAVLWEVGEWAGHTFLDPRIYVGYADTIGDLAAGLVGSVVAAVVLARRS